MNNRIFLEAIFGADYVNAHVTAFTNDPNCSTLVDWRGGLFGNYEMTPGNQYFVVSLFKQREGEHPRRRKADFLSAHCVVLDDVKEKLHMDAVSKLPEPSWVLETSAGSEQWGYILTTPCTDRMRMENLVDGLVANGLSPTGRDPGMKGVTRYVRLPDGINNKSNKCVGGLPYKCRLLIWEPGRKVTMKQLADPFRVDLEKPRREERVDGAARVDDHPVLDIVDVKMERSAGRYDICCPWADEHTGGVDNGAAVFTNEDGSLGFKCHHGACEGRNGVDLMRHAEEIEPGWRARYSHWLTLRSFDRIEQKMGATTAPETTTEGVIEEKKPEQLSKTATINKCLDKILSATPESDEHIEYGQLAVQALVDLEDSYRVVYEKRVCDQMGWSEKELKRLLSAEIKSKKFREKNADINFFDEVIYVAEQNQFFDRAKNLWLSPEAYQNKYSHLDEHAKKSALAGGRVMKVDKLDYSPKMPPIYEHDNGTVYGNSWHRGNEPMGVEGDCTVWLEHFNVLGWGQYRDHVLKWMAHTIRYPEKKINHMLIFGGLEGSGKDWLLAPLMKAMGGNATTIAGEELLADFNDYMLNTKYLHINELELGDRREAGQIANKLKPLAAAPPEKLRVNQKGVKKVEVTNLLSVTATTNSKLPFTLTGQSRRIFALWSDLNVRDSRGEMRADWRKYWRDAWNWMDGDGIDHCIWHLRNRVDLSTFYPREAPPLTEFLQEIVNQSNVVSIC